MTIDIPPIPEDVKAEAFRRIVEEIDAEILTGLMIPMLRDAVRRGRQSYAHAQALRECLPPFIENRKEPYWRQDLPPMGTGRLMRG